MITRENGGFHQPRRGIFSKKDRIRDLPTRNGAVVRKANGDEQA